MQNEKITIEVQVDETGKMKVNVAVDMATTMATLVTALDKAKDAVMEVFEMACKAENATSHYDRKALLQKTKIKSAKTI